MREHTPQHCPDCEPAHEAQHGPDLSRRDFVRTVGATVGGAALAAGVLPGLWPRSAVAAPKPASTAETSVGQFYDSLSEAQRKVICLPFNDPKRTSINANWHVTEPVISSDFYTTEQQKLIDTIFRGVTSEDGYERFQKQMLEDHGGMGQYSVAVCGEPGTDQFEWMMTGRHLTIRADGNTVKGAAFGGPIVYGHGEENPKDNVFHYQTKKANEVFQALDPKQREQALIAKAPKENQVPIQGKAGKFPGVAVGELSSDQQQLIEDTVKVILAPYREEDIKEALAMLKKGGGFKKLHLAFYKEGDLKSDQVWDIWRVEGPTFVWHFRGAPHVHTYVNIGMKKA